MASFWESVNTNLKAGYHPEQLVDAYAEHYKDLPQIAEYVATMRKQGADDRDILVNIGDALTQYEAPKEHDPYAAASEKIGVKRSLVPLGAALYAPVAGLKQAFGDEQAGIAAKEAEAGIERTIPGGRAGMLAGKIGIGSAVAAPMAGIGAGMTGAAGLATRAGALAVPSAAYRATDPMAADESRTNQALLAGGTAAVLSPVAEGAGAVVGALANKAADVVRNTPTLRAMFTGSKSSAAANSAAEAALRVTLKQEGVDYSTLSKEVKESLLKQVSGNLNPQGLRGNPLVNATLVEQQLGPEARATLGQASRSTEQMRFEQQHGGEDMYARQAAQSAALENKLKVLSSKISAVPADKGHVIQQAAIAKYREADKAVSAAYKAADEAVGDVPVPVDNLAEVISVNTELTPGVDVLVSKLKKAGVKFDQAGNLIPGQAMPAKVMHEIRKAASNMTAPGSQSAGVGYQIKKAIDGAFADSSIPQYREAARLARANFAQFEDRLIPATVTATRNNAGIEPIKEGSQIPKWLAGMPPEKLREFKKFLIAGNEKELTKIYANNPELKKSGIEGMRALKASMIDHLIEASTRKSTTGEAGQFVVSPDALVTAYKKIGEKKLAAVLDAKDFDNLRKIVKAAEIVSTPGRAQMKGSADANTALVRWFTERLGAMGPASIAVDVGGVAKGVSKASSASKSINVTPEKMAEQQARRRLMGDTGRIASGKVAATAGTEKLKEAQR